MIIFRASFHLAKQYPDALCQEKNLLKNLSSFLKSCISYKLYIPKQQCTNLVSTQIYMFCLIFVLLEIPHLVNKENTENALPSSDPMSPP
jgi:hypothetical protein